MEDLVNRFSDMGIRNDPEVIGIIAYDIDIIIFCYGAEKPSIFSDGVPELRISKLGTDLGLRRRFFESVQNENKMFHFINTMIWTKLPSYYFTDICPLIDEYIENTFKFYASK
jgi:hypothetical protein